MLSEDLLGMRTWLIGDATLFRNFLKIFPKQPRAINLAQFHYPLLQDRLHSDKYGAYEELAKKEKVTWCPCWAHIRRYFLEAKGGDQEFCSYVLRKIRYLYMLERIAKSRSNAERLKIRKEKEEPIINDLIERVKNNKRDGLFKTDVKGGFLISLAFM